MIQDRHNHHEPKLEHQGQRLNKGAFSCKFDADIGRGTVFGATTSE